MKKDLKVNIDGTNYDVEVFLDDNLNISSVNVNGEVVDIESIGQISDSELNSSNVSAKSIKSSKKTNPISTQNVVANDILAPMAGTVLKVEKQIGDEVRERDVCSVGVFVYNFVRDSSRLLSERYVVPFRNEWVHERMRSWVFGSYFQFSRFRYGVFEH